MSWGDAPVDPGSDVGMVGELVLAGVVDEMAESPDGGAGGFQAR